MEHLAWVPHERTQLAVVNDINLYSDDIRTMAPGNWLNDTAITFALEVLLNKLEPHRREKVHIVQPSICEMLKMSHDCDILSICFEGVDLASKDLVLFALNNNTDASKILGGNHWVLLVFNRSRGSFIYYDSLRNADEGALCWARHIFSLLVSADVLKVKNLQFEVGECAKQQNGSDCGMFVIEFTKVLLRDSSSYSLRAVSPANMKQKRINWIMEVFNMCHSK